MLPSIMITSQRNRPRIRYQQWQRSLKGEVNLGRSLWMRITVKAALASTLPCNLVSMVGSYTPLLSACH